jgi:hypothetical protein
MAPQKRQPTKKPVAKKAPAKKGKGDAKKTPTKKGGGSKGGPSNIVKVWYVLASVLLLAFLGWVGYAVYNAMQDNTPKDTVPPGGGDSGNPTSPPDVLVTPDPPLVWVEIPNCNSKICLVAAGDEAPCIPQELQGNGGMVPATQAYIDKLNEFNTLPDPDGTMPVLGGSSVFKSQTKKFSSGEISQSVIALSDSLSEADQQWFVALGMRGPGTPDLTIIEPKYATVDFSLPPTSLDGVFATNVVLGYVAEYQLQIAPNSVNLTIPNYCTNPQNLPQSTPLATTRRSKRLQRHK